MKTWRSGDIPLIVDPTAHPGPITLNKGKTGEGTAEPGQDQGVLEKNQGGTREEPGKNQARISQEPGRNQGGTRERTRVEPGKNQGRTREEPGKNQGGTREELM